MPEAKHNEGILQVKLIKTIEEGDDTNKSTSKLVDDDFTKRKTTYSSTNKTLDPPISSHRTPSYSLSSLSSLIKRSKEQEKLFVLLD